MDTEIKNIFSLIMAASLILISGCKMEPKENLSPETFITEHVEATKALKKEASLAYWAAATSGKSEDFDRQSELSLKIREVYSDSERFGRLEKIINSDIQMDALTARQINVLYNAYRRSQIPQELTEQLVTLANDIQMEFNAFRGTIDGKEVTNNDILVILKGETDSEKRKAAWQGSKQIAPVIAEDIIRLVKLRNEAAKEVGFDSYHTLSLESSEQNVAELDKLFDELDKLTQVPYSKMKAELDSKLAANCGIEVDQLMPWHYHDPFSQEAPMVQEIDLDVYYKGKDIEAISAEFYTGIGLDIADVLEKSDLYDRPGKNPHGFCTDIDKEGDVRILCNIKENEKWMEVQLHELGHAVYAKYHNRDVPYILRNPAHSFTTEAIAMIFGRLSGNALWMQETLGLTDAQRQELEEAAGEHTKLGQLIFARWVLVMYNFEKSLYADPDQDLNKLWWDMVGKYQFINRPKDRNAPDWAAKIHFVQAPCYYHSYLLGEMLASQLHHYMVDNIEGLKTDKGVSYVGQKEIGNYLRENVFEPGNIYHFNEMIKRATGEELTPKYFVEDFVN